jgi:undecaprenyl diphosphate synthase
MPKADPSQIKHVAFILDGNRRWAAEHGLPKLEGHKKGYENLKVIAEACFDRGIEVVSTYIFSTENWNRTRMEVNYLMDLAYKIFQSDLDELSQKGFKIVWSGTPEKLSKKIKLAIERTLEETKNNTKGTLNVCFNYGGQQEIAEAVKKIVNSGVSVDSIDAETVRAHLFHPELPAPDLIVRTSGEQRLSNFLLWDSAYAELMFVPQFWPDFDVAALDEVIAEYQRRSRRFGS